MPASGRTRLLLAAIAACFAATVALNFAYTTWALDAAFHRSCTLLDAQAHSAAYPSRIRDQFAALARQRGC
jgi:hypothetical protein